MIIINRKFELCIAFQDNEIYNRADKDKLFIPQELGWIGYLQFERFTKSGCVILSSDFRIEEYSYQVGINQKRGNRFHHTIYPSMVLAVQKENLMKTEVIV